MGLKSIDIYYKQCYYFSKSKNMEHLNINEAEQKHADQSFFMLGKNGISTNSYNEPFLQFVAETGLGNTPTEEVEFKTVQPLSTSVKRNMMDRYSYGSLLSIDDDKPYFELNKGLALIQSLITKQQNGESGHLKLNGVDNFLFMELPNGEVQKVSMYWYSGGWTIIKSKIEKDGSCGGRSTDNWIYP